VLQILSALKARQALEQEVRSDGAPLLVAALADVARQQVMGVIRARLGVTRRRVLFHMSDFLKTAMEIVDDSGAITSVSVLDHLVEIGDLIQENDTLFPVPLRLIEIPGKGSFLLLGTASSSSIPIATRIGLRAAGVGRIISSSAAETLRAPRDSIDSWLGTPITAPSRWMGLLESELHRRAEYAVLESDGVEMLARSKGSTKCAWQPLEEQIEDRMVAVLSQRGTSLIRLVNGNRVQGYLAVVGQPTALLRGHARVAKLSFDDGKRFCLALRAERGLQRQVRWGGPSSTTGGLLPIRIAWSEVPRPESMIRRLGTSFTISEGKQATAFDQCVVPLVDDVLSRLGFQVVMTNAN
jgi:hypothetical protein